MFEMEKKSTHLIGKNRLLQCWVLSVLSLWIQQIVIKFTLFSKKMFTKVFEGLIGNYI